MSSSLEREISDHVLNEVRCIASLLVLHNTDNWNPSIVRYLDVNIRFNNTSSFEWNIGHFVDHTLIKQNCLCCEKKYCKVVHNVNSQVTKDHKNNSESQMIDKANISQFTIHMKKVTTFTENPYANRCDSLQDPILSYVTISQENCKRNVIPVIEQCFETAMRQLITVTPEQHNIDNIMDSFLDETFRNITKILNREDKQNWKDDTICMWNKMRIMLKQLWLRRITIDKHTYFVYFEHGDAYIKNMGSTTDTKEHLCLFDLDQSRIFVTSDNITETQLRSSFHRTDKTGVVRGWIIDFLHVIHTLCHPVLNVEGASKMGEANVTFQDTSDGGLKKAWSSQIVRSGGGHYIYKPMIQSRRRRRNRFVNTKKRRMRRKKRPNKRNKARTHKQMRSTSKVIHIQ